MSRLTRSAKLRLELDELFAHRTPVIPEEPKRFVLDLLPLLEGAVVRRDALGRESRVPLPSVAFVGKVHQAIANQGMLRLIVEGSAPTASESSPRVMLPATRRAAKIGHWVLRMPASRNASL